ncbi:tRNA (adenosine(37)-N6)-threonylcarbamoyltransferase complex dimerization subunit type 1 TsaB [Legionella maioricensis]|uniref:tRNA threonylcarbamoyladenosine biosynthesis protein TsaB n=1 Tax=Legionella maioricensis TaxID=2896528 RepID=A0A9X2IAN8_9GAMM|nr:tRNA (adenosine(37)-N6)-threonylcarbamoyltransferase complex dimerization subunit type 1 TsaB [Legionella maioricensis]MCL9682702.1 tRNA (adenosine(37)-N6)-threonylcarbamoyltransferase complex dimerization subunit type 1 TsaB [Legionella maioricensis]MCL9687250.1 tRNA (adenosine(37)-N6)-threonylcarbamoyltransferase complex dimerization subunit type 1 TsaB [Legionella maioricensis]
MKLLAIDTSTEIASVALMVDDEISCEEQGSQKTHAQLILPMIDRLMVHADLQMNQLDGIIFGCGPGSFTGLRIACSIAKGLAYAHDLGLIPVSSLGAIAWAARELHHDATLPVLAVLDARMHEMYWSYFAEGKLESEERVNAVQEIQLPEQQSVILAGVGIDEYWTDFPDALKAQITAKVTLYPKATAMIQLAQHAVIKPVSIAQAQPVYVRNQVTQGGSRG